MAGPVITVANLGKRYQLSHAVRHDTLRDTVMHRVRDWLGRRSGAATVEDFWALRDVSFTVEQGDVVGIIGRNGAGKSTLLKILSRITEPTTGRISIRGRVASLLEVGTGFHPELSGRENIFLNGAILGMTRAEIRRKFDEIVAFAEVERFLDTPVKHYSSGMYVRLAFSVAAHLEPEILIVDEVLAVGDAVFQKKCLGKMESVARGEGRTVLFVSHNLSAMRELCRTGVLLSSGQVAAFGPIGEVVSRYTGLMGRRSQYVRPAPAPGSRPVATWFERVAVTDAAGITLESQPAGESAWLELELVTREALKDVQVAARVSTQEGVAVLTTTNTDVSRQGGRLEAGRHVLRAPLPAWLAPGFYSVTVAVHEPRRQEHASLHDVIQFEVSPGTSPSSALQDDRWGLVEPVIAWQSRHFQA
ncbi:MAG: ABC transporter ATP-binding protein [Verrucomicrobia bacterium]|nr:ABC transporter ATP-binding protein [Verrucomicrobiota bacterium]